MSLKVLGKEEQKKEYVYPLAFRNLMDGKIVLFYGISYGAVIDTGTSKQAYLGWTRTCWVNHDETTEWEPIDISIVHP